MSNALVAGPHAPKDTEGLRLLLDDFPWPYNDRRETRRDNADKKPKFGIGAHRRYSAGTMGTGDILDMGRQITPILAQDAYRFCWATCPRLELALSTFPAFGFEYKTVSHCWEKIFEVSGKSFQGPGRYTFSNIELVLLGVRGRPWHSIYGFRPRQVLPNIKIEIDWDELCAEHDLDPVLSWNQVMKAPHPVDELGKKIHSRKPLQVIEDLSRWFPNTIKLELFATQYSGRADWWHAGHALDQMDIRDKLTDIRTQQLRFDVLHGGQDIFQDLLTEP